MATESKIKESQIESPMKNMPCHEDPKQRNVVPTIAESHFSKSNFFRSPFFNFREIFAQFSFAVRWCSLDSRFMFARFSFAFPLVFI